MNVVTIIFILSVVGLTVQYLYHREALERIILQMGTEHEAIFEECKRLYKERDEGHVLHVEDLPTYPDARWLRHDVGPDGTPKDAR